MQHFFLDRFVSALPTHFIDIPGTKVAGRAENDDRD